MALWGTKDTVYSTGNINVNVTTGVVTRQSGTINWSSIEVGQVLTVEGSEGVIESIDVATGNSAQLTIGTEYLPAANISNKGYEIREKPKSTLHDSNWGAGEIYGVDTTEITVANAASGNARKYAPPHAGWVGITTYNDNAGNLRVKHEVLVAGSSVLGGSDDSGDDTLLPDS